MPPSRMSIQENRSVTSWMDSTNFDVSFDSLLAGNVLSRDRSPSVPGPSRLQSGESSQQFPSPFSLMYYVWCYCGVYINNNNIVQRSLNDKCNLI